MRVDDTRTDVQRLESLLLRWWWKASFITLAAGAYLLMLPAVIRFAAADIVAKEESDKLFPETPSPTLESIWSESRNRLRQYHEIALSHSTRAFNAAMIAMGLGGVVLAAAVFYLLAIPGGRDWSTTVPVAGIAGLSSAYATAIARTFFATMNKTSDQLSDFFTQPTDESHAMLVQALVADEPTETRLALKSEFIRSLSTPSGAATESEGESKR